MTTLEIVNPIAGKGIEDGRLYLSYPEIRDEANYVEIGVLVRDDSGKAVRNAEVTVECTDPEQAKVINGTGAIYTIRNEDGSRTKLFFYPFSYQIKTPGEHTITFKVTGAVDAATSFTAVADERPDPLPTP